MARWPAKLSDAYVRGNDLVATYQATDAWPFAPQIYWRADTLQSVDELSLSVSLLVSVSTHLLDTHPQICAVTQLAADEILHVVSSDNGNPKSNLAPRPKRDDSASRAGACCLLWRLPGGMLSYAEIVPASDFRELTVRHEKDGTCHARWELIAEFLEKGVIRRTRLQSVFLTARTRRGAGRRLLPIRRHSPIAADDVVGQALPDRLASLRHGNCLTYR